NRLELVVARIAALACVRGVHELVEQRGGRIPDAGRLELGAEIGVPGDDAAVEEGPIRGRARPDDVARAVLEPPPDAQDLGRLAARIDALAHLIERVRDPKAVTTGDELSVGCRGEDEEPCEGAEHRASLAHRAAGGQPSAGKRTSPTEISQDVAGEVRRPE